MYVIYAERLGERVRQKEKVFVCDVGIEIERKNVWERNGEIEKGGQREKERERVEG